MNVELCEIPGVEHGGILVVRALCVNGKSEVLEALSEWRASAPHEHKRIIGGLNIIKRLSPKEGARHPRVSPDRMGRGIYELCNREGGNARLLFFYDRDSRLIVVSNSFWKGRRDQESAFERAAQLKSIYESSY